MTLVRDTETDHPIVTDLAAYFSSSALVCPFGRIVGKLYLSEKQVMYDTLLSVISALSAYEAVIIYASAFPALFEDGQKWAHEMFQRIGQELEGMKVEIKAYARIMPFMCFGNMVFYIIGMGPQYPSRHPRYAPHLCIVITNERQIREVPANQRKPVHHELVNRIGCVYDADYVWLPLRPEPRKGFN